MQQIINAMTYSDSRGTLSVIDNILPFEVKRIFYIYNVKDDRGNHRQKRNKSALLCVKGSCKVRVNDGKSVVVYDLNLPEKILILGPDEYRTMFDFSEDAVLLVLSSEHYDADDYINSPIQ